MAKILIIDDDDLMLAMLKQLFSRAGYQTYEAGNGVEGIKLYHQNRPDLVVTDIIMPDKEGIETIMELKRENPSLKIIAISGGGRSGPDDYLEMAEKLGASKVLKKPFEPDEMLKAVKELLGSSPE